jgi:hypothetical protein
VLAIKSCVAPWRIVRPVRSAKAVVVVPTGRIRLQVGQRVAVSYKNFGFPC